jgi:hypothetical protein
MLRTTMRIAVLAALVVVGLTAAASPAAATWSTNGPVNFTATTGTTQFRTSSGASLTCTGTNGMTGTLLAMTHGSGLPLISPLSFTFASCRVATLPFTVSCASTVMNGAGWTANGGVTPNWFGSLTTGQIPTLTCTLVIPNCTTTIATPILVATYTNPTASVAGRFTIPAAGQNLRVSNNGSATCTALRVNNGDAVLFSDSLGGNAVYTVTAPAVLTSQPRIWQP